MKNNLKVMTKRTISKVNYFFLSLFIYYLYFENESVPTHLQNFMFCLEISVRQSARSAENKKQSEVTLVVFVKRYYIIFILQILNI